MIVSSPVLGIANTIMRNSFDEEINALKYRVTELLKKVDELYRRPQMDYTDYASSGDVCTFDVTVPNRTAGYKPRWSPGFPATGTPTSTYQKFWSLPQYGQRIEKYIENLFKKTKQPYITVTSTSGATVGSGTDTTTAPTFNFSSVKTEDVSGTLFVTETYHWEEIAPSVFGWTLTNTTADTTWGGNPPGQYTNTATTGTTMVTLARTTRYTPGPTTTPTTPTTPTSPTTTSP